MWKINTYSETREKLDFYATRPSDVEKIIPVLKTLNFNNVILEPCAGNGHISEVLKKNGYKVISQDIVQRDYPLDDIKDVLQIDKNEYDIVTNPPFFIAFKLIINLLIKSAKGTKLLFLLPLSFLEGIERYSLYSTNPPKIVFVNSKRVQCAKNGNFKLYKSSGQIYAWFYWEVGSYDECKIKWIK